LLCFRFGSRLHPRCLDGAGSLPRPAQGQTLKPYRLRAPLRVSVCPAVARSVCAGAVAAILYYHPKKNGSTILSAFIKI
jgi:hypothetical protein